jgi:hypothetical protein
MRIVIVAALLDKPFCDLNVRLRSFSATQLRHSPMAASGRKQSFIPQKFTLGERLLCAPKRTFTPGEWL